jgi:hypothetical protein
MGCSAAAELGNALAALTVLSCCVVLLALRCQMQSITSPFSINKTGPATVKPGQAFAYNVTVTFQGNATGVTVVDDLPPFLTASSNGSSWKSVTANGQNPSGGKQHPKVLQTRRSVQQRLL